MGLKQSSASKRASFMSALEPEIAPTLRRRSVIPTASAIPTPFNIFRSFSDEWNLCGMYDSSRRVNVVADLKLQRKRLPYLLVSKCVKMRATESLQLLRNELEMLLFLVRYSQFNIGFMHPNILQLRGFFTFRNKLHVFVEFCELGSLKRAYLLEPNPLLRMNFSPTEGEVRDAVRQIGSSLVFLHTNGVAHCDVALDNIFVTSMNVLKLGDFDHAVFVGTENQLQPTKYDEPRRPIYAAPELHAHHSSGDKKPIDLQKADVWALGVVLIELYTKKPIFDSTAATDRGFQLFRKIGLRSYLRAMYLEQTAICKFSDDMLELLDGLLQVEPMKRLTAREAMQSRWLQTADAIEEEEEEEEPQEQNVDAPQT
jgi:serine/threonine protein kinase